MPDLALYARRMVWSVRIDSWHILGAGAGSRGDGKKRKRDKTKKVTGHHAQTDSLFSVFE